MAITVSPMSCPLLIRLTAQVSVWLPKFFISSLSQFEFPLVILFLLSCLEVLASINSAACVFTEFINEFIYVLFEVLQHAHKCFEVLVYSSCAASLRAHWSRVAGSGADVLSWALMIMSLCLSRGIWDWDDCDCGCWYLGVFCWVGFAFFSFCCLLLIFRTCGGWGVPVRGCFWIPVGVAMGCSM